MCPVSELPIHRVLIVEDDRLQYVITSRLLLQSTTARYEVDWAPDYEEGWIRLTSGSYSLCLLDYMLGERDGLQLLEAVRSEGVDTPVIFLTAESSESVDMAAMNVGAADFLVKGEITVRSLERSIRYALKLGAAMAELKRLAAHDELTGLLNRREGISRIERARLRAMSGGGGYALLICDFDHFKAINDTHGHPAGDAVLAEFARRLNWLTQGEESAIRLGGEEFAVLMPGRTREAALEFAEKLRGLMAATPVAIPGATAIKATISVGVATWAPSDTEAGKLLARADRGLYAAKSAGRDRVCEGI